MLVCLGLQGQLLKWARGVATEHFESLLSGGGGVGLRYQLAHKLVLGRLHVKLGLDRYEHVGSLLTSLFFSLIQLQWEDFGLSLIPLSHICMVGGVQ
jgi:hypothetical protein